MEIVRGRVAWRHVNSAGTFACNFFNRSHPRLLSHNPWNDAFRVLPDEKRILAFDTVGNYLIDVGIGPSQTWRSFLSPVGANLSGFELLSTTSIVNPLLYYPSYFSYTRRCN